MDVFAVLKQIDETYKLSRINENRVVVLPIKIQKEYLGNMVNVCTHVVEGHSCTGSGCGYIH